MTRPALNPIPLADVFPPRRGLCYVTASPGQWDAVLEAAYAEGWVLLEVNDREQFTAAYRNPTHPPRTAP